MSPIIEIRPAPGEKNFDPKKVTVSKKVLADMAVDVVTGDIMLGVKQDQKSEDEKKEISVAMAEASREA